MKSGIAKRISIEIRMCVGSNGAGLTVVVGPALFCAHFEFPVLTVYIIGNKITVLRNSVIKKRKTMV